jgi:predicted tellurium resistance membrane protein TerC
MSDLILIALFDGSWLGQTFEWNDLIVVGMLILLEGVLSIDNALVLGLLAKRLPAHQRSRALSYGLIGAFVFRVLAILLAGFLLQWTIAKLLGGGYLIYIALKHLLFEGHEDESDRVVLDSQGHPILVDAATGQELSPEREDLEIEERVPIGSSLVIDHADTHASAAPKTNGSTSPFKTSRAPAVFWRTVLVIELTDIAFAVDSILAAMALAGSRSSKLWVVIAGGIIGLVLMRFAAVVFIRLLDRFPRFVTSGCRHWSEVSPRLGLQQRLELPTNALAAKTIGFLAATAERIRNATTRLG